MAAGLATAVERGSISLRMSPQMLTRQADARLVPATGGKLDVQEASPGAGAANPQRLTSLAANALRSQPLVNVADARARVDFEKIEQARASLRPNAAASVNIRREFENTGSTVPFQNYAAGAQVSVPLYRPAAGAGVDAAQAQFDATQSGKFETERDLLAALATAYVAAGQLKGETGLLMAERDGLAIQRVLNERRMNGGIGTLVEVLETAARVEFLQGQVRGSEGTEHLQLAELARLANMPVASVPALSERAPVSMVPDTAARALVQAREQNATLKRLRLAVESARANVTLQQAGSSAAVDLVGSLDRSRFEFNGSRSQVPSALVGVRLTVPLLTGGLIDARVREARASLDRTQAELEDAELTLQADIVKSYADFARARGQLEANLAALAMANASLKATVKAFDAGVRGNIDVLNAQQQTFSGRRESLRARAAVYLAQIRILALLGTLGMEQLAKLEAMLTE